MLQEQFLDLKDFAFLELVNPHCFINWKNGVPAEYFELLERYMVLFLNFLCLNSNFSLFRDSDFHKAGSQELLDYISNLNLQSCF